MKSDHEAHVDRQREKARAGQAVGKSADKRVASNAGAAGPGIAAGKIPKASEGSDAADNRFRPSPMLERRIDALGAELRR